MILIAILAYIALLLLDDGTDTNMLLYILPRWIFRLVISCSLVLVVIYTLSVKYTVEATSFRQVYFTVHDRYLTTAQTLDSSSRTSLQVESIQPASQDDVSIIPHSTK